MDVKKEARPAVGSKRATDLTIDNSLSRAVKYRTARNEKSELDRGYMAVALAFAAMTALYAVGLAAGAFH